jgi:hypothetical protein
VALQCSAGVPAVEQQHVHAEPAEAHALAIDDAQQLHGFTFDAGFFTDLFDWDFNG